MPARHGLEFWREHVENWCRSGLNQREYCANNDWAREPFIGARPVEGIHSGGKEITDVGASERGQAGNSQRRSTTQPGRLGNRVAGPQRSVAGRLPEASC